MVGMELDLHDFARYRRRSVVFGLASALIPGVVGTAAAMALGYSTPSALLVGSAFASHTLLAYPIASRLGILRNEAVNVTLGGTILAEILALGLAVVVEARKPLGWTFWAGLALPLRLRGGVCCAAGAGGCSFATRARAKPSRVVLKSSSRCRTCPLGRGAAIGARLVGRRSIRHPRRAR